MQHVMFQLIFMFQTLSAQHNEKLLQQLKQVLKEQLTGIIEIINQNQHYRHDIIN